MLLLITYLTHIKSEPMPINMNGSTLSYPYSGDKSNIQKRSPYNPESNNRYGNMDDHMKNHDNDNKTQDSYNPHKEPKELNLLSLNVHVNRDTLESQQVREIKKLTIDTEFNILALQSASGSLMESLENELKDKYNVACKKSESTDIRFNKKEYLPIFFDKTFYVVEENPVSDSFQNFGCLVTFMNKINHKFITIMNIDMYSSKEEKTGKQFYLLLKRFYSTKFYKYPVFIAGTINNTTEELRMLINEYYLNLVEMDKEHSGVTKTTYHEHGTLQDNIQRDYILMNDEHGEYEFNSAKILNDMDKIPFGHYGIKAKLLKKHTKEPNE